VNTKALEMSSVMSGQNDASAAIFIPEDVRYALLQFAPPGTIVWPRAQVWPMTTDNINWPKLVQDITVGSEDFFGNVILTWTEEGGEKQETRPQFETLRLTCHELSAYTEVTDVLLEDSAINLGNLLTQLFQGAYWHYTDRIFLQGMGATRPLGVLNDPGVNTVNRVTANKVQYEDMINLSTAHPSLFDRDSVWFMSKSCFNSLRKQKDDVGQPVIQLGEGYNNFGEGIAGFAIGYPIILSDYKTSALGTTGDIMLGNWKHYFIGERKSISIEMSKHAVFRHNRTAFRCSARLGGIPEEPKAFTVLSSTADASQAS
jgi:HK97 family phage major capsid protein